MNIVHDLTAETWRRFVQADPRGTIFCTPEMFQVWTHTRGHTPEIWAAVENDEILALLLPVQITLRAGFAERFTRRAVVYGDVLLTPGARGQRGLECLLAAYTHTAAPRVLFTELRQHDPLAPSHTTLRSAGFVEHKYLNYVIDLQRPVEQIFNAIGAHTRKHIRRAQRAGRIQVMPVETREQLDDWYAVLRATYARARVPLPDASLFQAAFERLRPCGLCQFWLARVDSAPAACSVELLYKRRMIGWYGGTDRTYRQFNPNELLTWHILEWGARHNFACYDFGGAGRVDTPYGVREFKAKFGGLLVSESRMRYVHSPRALALSELGYWLFGRVLFGRESRPEGAARM